MSKRVLEGKWDCQHCGTKGIGGLTKTCPNCGKPVGTNQKYYLDHSDADEVDAAYETKGEDWLCSYCGSYNPADKDVCQNCNAPREEGENYFAANKKKEEPASQPKARSGFSRRIGILFAVIAAVIVLLIALAVPRDTTITVDSKSWERIIQIQEYRTVQESDWSLPDGGRLDHTANEIHHYDQVLDHYEEVAVTKSRTVQDGYTTHTRTVDNGNGTFTEETYETPNYRTEYYTEYETQPVYVSVPVYMTKYYYDIEKWIDTRTADSSGEDDDVYWAETNLAENEREDERSEMYEISFVDEKGRQVLTKECTYDSYMSLHAGDKVSAEKNQFGAILSIDIE